MNQLEEATPLAWQNSLQTRLGSICIIIRGFRLRRLVSGRLRNTERSMHVHVHVINPHIVSYLTKRNHHRPVLR